MRSASSAPSPRTSPVAHRAAGRRRRPRRRSPAGAVLSMLPDVVEAIAPSADSTTEVRSRRPGHPTLTRRPSECSCRCPPRACRSANPSGPAAWRTVTPRRWSRTWLACWPPSVRRWCRLTWYARPGPPAAVHGGVLGLHRRAGTAEQQHRHAPRRTPRRFGGSATGEAAIELRHHTVSDRVAARRAERVGRAPRDDGRRGRPGWRRSAAPDPDRRRAKRRSTAPDRSAIHPGAAGLNACCHPTPAGSSRRPPSSACQRGSAASPIRSCRPSPPAATDGGNPPTGLTAIRLAITARETAGWSSQTVP